jgi:hypothetical protein
MQQQTKKGSEWTSGKENFAFAWCKKVKVPRWRTPVAGSAGRVSFNECTPPTFQGRLFWARRVWQQTIYDFQFQDLSSVFQNGRLLLLYLCICLQGENAVKSLYIWISDEHYGGGVEKTWHKIGF